MALWYDEDIYTEHMDTSRNYVLKKNRLLRTDGFSGRHERFHAENVDGEFKNGDDFEIGISKESWVVTNSDGYFIEQQHEINKGKYRSIEKLIDIMEDY